MKSEVEEIKRALELEIEKAVIPPYTQDECSQALLRKILRERHEALVLLGEIKGMLEKIENRIANDGLDTF